MTPTNILNLKIVSFETVNECFVTMKLETESITALGLLWKPSEYVLEISWISGFVKLSNRDFEKPVRFVVMAIDATNNVIHCVTMCDEVIDLRNPVVRGILEGTLTIGTQKQLKRMSNLTQTITYRTRRDLFATFEGARSFSSTTNGTALVTRQIALSTIVPLDTWRVGVLIPKQGTLIVNVEPAGEEGQKKITSPVPPIVFLKWGRNKNAKTGEDPFLRTQLLLVLTESCKFYTSPKLNLSEFHGIAVLGRYMQQDIYFNKIVSKLNPYIPVPQEMLDITKNIKEHEGKNTTTCGAIMNPLDYKCKSCSPGSENAMNEFNKKGNQEQVFNCEYAQTFQGVNQIAGNSATLEKQLDTMPCEIKHILRDRYIDSNSTTDAIRQNYTYEYRAYCAPKPGQENAVVYTPNHPIWTIPVPTPVRPPYHGSNIFEELVEATFIRDSFIVSLPKTPFQITGSRVSTYRADVVSRIIQEYTNRRTHTKFYLRIPKLSKNFEIVGNIVSNDENEAKLRIAQAPDFTAPHILCKFTDSL